MSDIKDRLIKPRLPERDVHLEGVGTLRVRGLSHNEVLMIRKATDDKPDGPRVLQLERKMLALALVDPVMTEAEVGQWQQAAPAGELDQVSRVVQELSGLLDNQPKSNLPRDGGRS